MSDISDGNFSCFRDDSPLQRPCTCGKGKGEQCIELGLMNHRNFSPFAYLQEDANDVDDDYYHETAPGQIHPARHWALIGEIKECDFECIPPKISLRTRFGETFFVHFHLKLTSLLFKWDNFKPDSTMCIFYPKRHQFPDLTEGIQQKDAETVMVFPAPQEILTQECCFLADYSHATCFGCSQQEKQLGRCPYCQLAYYCSRACQVGHWKSAHRKLCKYYKDIFKIVRLDFSKPVIQKSRKRIIESDAEYKVRKKMKKETKLAKCERQKNKSDIAAENDNDTNYSWGDFCSNDPIARPIQQALQEAGFTEPNPMQAGAWPVAVVGTDLTAVAEVSKSDRFLKLLEQFEGTILEDDTISSRIFETQGFLQDTNLLIQSATSSPLSENVIFQAMTTLARSFSESKGSGHQFLVADLKSNSLMEDHNALLTTLFLSLPQWQLQEDIRGMCWSFETHHLLEEESTFPSSEWKLMHDPGVLMAEHEHALAYYGHDLKTVSNLALSMADKCPNYLVVQVLRAAGDTTNEELFLELAKSKTPANMVTLWIREHFTEYTEL